MTSPPAGKSARRAEVPDVADAAATVLQVRIDLCRTGLPASSTGCARIRADGFLQKTSRTLCGALATLALILMARRAREPAYAYAAILVAATASLAGVLATVTIVIGVYTVPADLCLLAAAILSREIARPDLVRARSSSPLDRTADVH